MSASPSAERRYGFMRSDLLTGRGLMGWYLRGSLIVSFIFCNFDPRDT